MAKIITVTQKKGGCGKTTTAIHLSAYFSQQGRAVLIDGDPNRSSLEWQARGAPFPFEVVNQSQALKAMERGCDWLVIDTKAHPDPGELRELASGCDLLILPCPPDALNVEPMAATVNAIAPTLAKTKAEYRVLLTMVPSYPSKDGERSRSELLEAQIPVFERMIRKSICFPHAANQGRLVSQIDRGGVCWQDYVAIGREIEEILGGNIGVKHGRL